MDDKSSPMSGAERVRRSRWVNRVEETADTLLELLRDAPDPLPRVPEIDPALWEELSKFTIETQDDQGEEDYPKVRFLELGNGHQVANKRRAIDAVAKLFGAKKLDRNTIEFGDWGVCHFASYTHPKGAMISTPNRDDNEYGKAEWHQRDHIALFRDVGDGRCMLYISDIEPLFGLRTIGHHGVTWDNVRKVARVVKVVASQDAIAAANSSR